MARIRQRLERLDPRVAAAAIVLVFAGAGAAAALAPPNGMVDLATRLFAPLSVIVGVAMWRRRPGHIAGPAFVIMAVWSQTTAVLAATNAPVPWTAALVLQEWHTPLLIWAVLAFPSGRMTRVAWTLVAVRAVNAILIRQLDHPFLEPKRWSCFDCPLGVNLLMIRDDPGLTVILDDIGLGLAVLEMVALIAVLGARLWRATPAARRVLRPVAIPMIVASGGVLAGNVNVLAMDIGGATSWTPAVVERLALIPALTLLWLPLGILWGFRLEARRRERVADVVADARAGVPLLLAAVRKALGDPSATIVAGPEPPSSQAAGSVTPLVHAGRRIGSLVHDPAAADDPRLMGAVASTAALALANAQLSAELAAQVAQIRGSRARLVFAGEEARRSVERDLERGAEVRLNGAIEAVTEAGAAADEALAPVLAELRDDLRTTLAEVRALAQGLLPAVLREQGLGPALGELAAASPIPVTVRSTPDRPLPTEIEVAAWFVVSEALANVAKHATATSITVRADTTHEDLRVEVSDDGRGGADATGDGLAGIAERVREAGGVLNIESPAGAGTTVSARFPIAGVPSGREPDEIPAMN